MRSRRAAAVGELGWAPNRQFPLQLPSTINDDVPNPQPHRLPRPRRVLSSAKRKPWERCHTNGVLLVCRSIYKLLRNELFLTLTHPDDGVVARSAGTAAYHPLVHNPTPTKNRTFQKGHAISGQ